MKTYTCEMCKQDGFATPQAVGAHKRKVHPGNAKKKKKQSNKNSLAMTVISAEVQPPSIEGVKYCPECGHFLFPYNAALTAMKGKRP